MGMNDQVEPMTFTMVSELIGSVRAFVGRGEILMEWEQRAVWEVVACMEDARFCHLKLGE